MDNLNIAFICILVVMLIALVIFKNQFVRNINIGLYCLFVIYGYLNINKKHALVGFVGLLVTYALVRSKPIEVVENMTNMNAKTGKRDEYKLPTRKSIEPCDEGLDKNTGKDISVDVDEEEEEDAAEEEEEDVEEEDEKGIEQFGLADKFTQLHGMIHKMQNAAAKQQAK
jgi:hypothetical protein